MAKRRSAAWPCSEGVPSTGGAASTPVDPRRPSGVPVPSGMPARCGPSTHRLDRRHRRPSSRGWPPGLRPSAGFRTFDDDRAGCREPFAQLPVQDARPISQCRCSHAGRGRKTRFSAAVSSFSKRQERNITYGQRCNMLRGRNAVECCAEDQSHDQNSLRSPKCPRWARRRSRSSTRVISTRENAQGSLCKMLRVSGRGRMVKVAA